MFGSHSDYFQQSPKVLYDNWRKIKRHLTQKNHTKEQIDVYKVTYDYLMQYPEHYDGETLAKDLVDICGLAIPSTKHDKDYVVYRVGSNLKYAFKSAFWYYSALRKMGHKKSKCVRRFLGLVLGSPFYLPVSVIKYGFMTKETKKLFNNDYKIMMK